MPDLAPEYARRQRNRPRQMLILVAVVAFHVAAIFGLLHLFGWGTGLPLPWLIKVKLIPLPQKPTPALIYQAPVERLIPPPVH